MARLDTQDVEDPTLRLPRILCLHGGGTNSRIFRAQCRVLTARLNSRFRFCFAEAPLPSHAGPDVLSVYKNLGPFRAWLPLLPGCLPGDDFTTVTRLIENSLRAAREEDDSKGATGEWVGLLGFSQGAKICASLLFEQQLHAEKMGLHRVVTRYRFAVLLAGRAPLISFDSVMVDARQTGEYSRLSNGEIQKSKDNLLRLPTLHVHGMKDPGLHLHRQLLDDYCDRGSARLVEWNGAHRVPIKSTDIASVVNQILILAEETGVCF